MKAPCICTLSILLTTACLQAIPHEILLRELTSNHFVDTIDSEIISKEYGEETIIKIEEGTRLPLQFHIEGPILSIENTESSPVLVVHETFYVKILPAPAKAGCFYCDGEMGIDSSTQFFFSHDTLEWRSFEEFFGGSLKANIAKDEFTQALTANISLDVQFRAS